ncbi:MAG: hypothetical protein QXL67_03345 [Candidatus Bathyarchaeia archaeon]
MNSQEKIDALDFIINVLKEHEKRLDSLAENLTRIVEELKSTRTVDALQKPVETRPKIQVLFNDWLDFKEKSRNSDLIVFDLDERNLRFNSVSGSSIYQYSEFIEEIRLLLDREGENYRVKRGDIKAFLEKLGQKKFKCGVEASTIVKLVSLEENVDALVFKFYPDVNKLRDWLAEELNLPRENIIHGRLVS